MPISNQKSDFSQILFKFMFIVTVFLAGGFLAYKGFHPFNPEVTEKQKRRLQEVKSSREKSKVEESLLKLKHAAKTSENLMPHILKAVRYYASLGEITGIFKEVFGEFREPATYDQPSVIGL